MEHYLARTADLDTHWCAHLKRLEGLKLSGKTVLSDAFTSYYARGMLGTYCLTTPRLLTSPVLNYDAMDANARRKLATGPNAVEGGTIDAVIVEKKRGWTAALARITDEQIKQRWIEGGWRVVYEDADVLALMP